MTLSAVEIAQLSQSVLGGFTGDKAKIATAIALAESGGNELATNTNSNGTIDAGLWQINSVHKKSHPSWTIVWLQKPENNAKAMQSLSKGGSDWSPWTTYKSGAYKSHLDTADKAVKGIASDTSISDQVGGIPGVDAVETAVSSIGDALGKVGSWISNTDNWIRVAQVVGGLGLALIAVAIIGNSVVKKV